MIVHQFHSGTDQYDAVTNELFRIRSLLRKQGFTSNIFAEHIHPKLSKEIQNYKILKRTACDLLIVHHSMGYDAFSEIVNLPMKKVLRYHNITPEKYFDTNTSIAHYVRKGREQLQQFKNKVSEAWPCSFYSALELASIDYPNIEVLPYGIALPKISEKENISKRKDKENISEQNLIFVGRFVYNKRQDDLIRLVACYHEAYPEYNVRLTLIGNMECCPEFTDHIKKLINHYQVQDRVNLCGRVNNQSLFNFYRNADVFVSMSEHEGFSVPIVEAMHMRLPVVAYAGGAVEETVGSAGLVLHHKDWETWVDVLYSVLVTENLRLKMVEQGLINCKRFQPEAFDMHLNDLVHKAIIRKKSTKKTVLWEGPFETSYSLAFVNRKTANAWEKLGKWKVRPRPSEGTGDYVPTLKNILDHVNSAKMWLRGIEEERPDVHVRNMFPPRTDGMNGRINIYYWAWEETGIPTEWIKKFNSDLNGIAVPSSFVRDALVRNGIRIPVRVIPHGVELESPCGASKENRLLNGAKQFRFLHISSAFPRKGVDILVKAYFEEFTEEDDVTLVIKTFPNPQNQVSDILINYSSRHQNLPQVIHIDKDIERVELEALYEACDVLIYPSRGEGFGFPIAEAMASGMPVVVSGAGGHRDFCQEDNSWLIPFKMVPSSSHLSTSGSLWCEPDVGSLRRIMRWHYEHPDDQERKERIEKATNTIRKYKWQNTAEQLERFVEDLETNKPIKAAMVSTWNTRCGIATYSNYLVEHFEPGEIEWKIFANHSSEARDAVSQFYVDRCWNDRGSHVSYQDLRHSLQSFSPDIIHIQFNYGLFDLEDLSKLIQDLTSDGFRVVITAHATSPVIYKGRQIHLGCIAEGCNAAAALIVHTEKDKKQLESFGIKSVEVIPHGSLQFDDEEIDEVREKLKLKDWAPIISTFGFLLPPKGILEALESISILRQDFPRVVLLAMCSKYPSGESENYFKKCKQKIKDLKLTKNVILITDFLDEDAIIKALHSSDVVILPYTESGESASGAVRFPLASCRPVITTDLPIFGSLRDCTLQVPPRNPTALAEAIKQVLEDKVLASSLKEKARELVSKESWTKVANLHLNLYKRVSVNR
jgi:glycosyltransferase involved in cell wall biosynthesis